MTSRVEKDVIVVQLGVRHGVITASVIQSPPRHPLKAMLGFENICGENISTVEAAMVLYAW